MLDDLNELEADEDAEEVGCVSYNMLCLSINCALQHCVFNIWSTILHAQGTTAAAAPASPEAKAMRRTAQPLSGDVEFLGKPTGTAGTATLFGRASVGGAEVKPGDGVVLRGRSAEEEEAHGPLLGLVQAMWKDAKGMVSRGVASRYACVAQASPTCSCGCWSVASRRPWAMLHGTRSSF